MACGLVGIDYRDALVANCGRICIYRKKVNISTVLAGQKLGIKEVDDGIWLVSFMHYDLGYIDLEQRTLQTIDNPFGTRLSPIGLHPFGETAISNSSPGCELRLVSLAAVARDWLRKRPARDSRGPSAGAACCRPPR
ncbi:hypothetical protein EV128_1272 [Rhizobium azibense]|nr:hypothetical protein EV128_1272 [Rhizobium azibense]